MDDEKENELTPDMKLHQLYDMTEDVAESAKLKHAESSLMIRQTEDGLVPSTMRTLADTDFLNNSGGMLS